VLCKIFRYVHLQLEYKLEHGVVLIFKWLATLWAIKIEKYSSLHNVFHYWTPFTAIFIESVLKYHIVKPWFWHRFILLSNFYDSLNFLNRNYFRRTISFFFNLSSCNTCAHEVWQALLKFKVMRMRISENDTHVYNVCNFGEIREIVLKAFEGQLESLVLILA